MADNTDVTPGTGATIATDDVSGVHYQKVKLVDATADSSTATGVAANPLQVSLANHAANATAVKVDGSAVTQPVSASNLDIRDLSSASDSVTAAVSSIAAGDNNIGNVDLASAIPAGDNNIGNVDVLTVPAPLSTTGGGTEATALRVTIANDSTGVVSIDDNGSAITVDNGGTFAVQATLAAETTKVIGTVNVAAAQTIAVTQSTPANLTCTATLAAGTNTNEVVGDVAHSAGVAGNPVLICGASQDMDDTAPPNRVDAEADATRLAMCRDGAIFAHPHGPQVWSYHLDTSTAQTDASVHAAPSAGLSLYVTDIVFSSGAATAINLFFEEGASKVLGPYYLEAVAGRGIHIQFQTPKKITPATALTLTTSASIAHCVDVTGFVAQG